MAFILNPDYRKIFFFHPTICNRIVARESSWLEFKESFNWLSRDKYARSMAAFANVKGGYIVFGVKNLPRELVGLQSDNFENTDEAKITGYLNDVLLPEIEYEKFTIQVSGKIVGILSLSQSRNKPIVCRKNDGDLKDAEIYYRYNARSEKIKYPELKILLEEIKKEERKSWMEHFERISRIGPRDAAILDVIDGTISGRGGTLVIDKKLIPKLKFINSGSFRESGKPVLRLIGDVKPVSVVVGRGGKKSVGSVGVQITDDPNAPVTRLEEKDLKKKYPLDYKTLTKSLSARYKDFKQNQKYHQLRKQFMQDKRLCFTRHLDPDNSKSARKDFYSPSIYKKFDEYYKK